MTTSLFLTAEPYNPVGHHLLLTPPTGSKFQQDIAARCYNAAEVSDEKIREKARRIKVYPLLQR